MDSSGDPGQARWKAAGSGVFGTSPIPPPFRRRRPGGGIRAPPRCPTATGWFKSSFSQGDDINCVEVNLCPGAVYVRHSQHPADAVIRHTHAEWDAFTRGVKADAFDSGNR